MTALIQIFLNIALRKQGPEDLPASSFLLALTLLVSILIHIPLTWLVFGTVEVVIMTLIVDIGLLLGFLWLLLRLTGYISRFGQTLTALLGTSALLSVFSVPFALWNASIPDPMPKPFIPSAFILVIVIWSLVVDGHILSRALSRPFAIGLIIAIAYFLLHTQLLVELMPGIL
jgi:hypothetical protein